MKKRLLKYIYYIFLIFLLVFITISTALLILQIKKPLLTTFLLLLWALLSFFIIKYLHLKFIIYTTIKKLSTTTFVSVDCSVGELYRQLNLPYLSPFTDILLGALAYNNILKDIKFHLSQPVTFISRENALTLKEENEHILVDYPIFQLGSPNIEIHWIHSHNEEDIKNKWNRRKEKINYERIITINAPKEYKNKFFRNIQTSDGEIKITKNNKDFVFLIRKQFSNEANWEYNFEQMKIISESLEILLLLI